ncbi:hypothetical protein HDU98_008640 [Podochytrium sp. JEL0797]|nr:hypothetical protein HDU98_008640 [Podochytrium sp. JEL0797]
MPAEPTPDRSLVIVTHIRFAYYLAELEKQPVGLSQTGDKDYLFSNCFYSFMDFPAGSVLPADLLVFKNRLKSLAARAGEHPYYQGIAWLVTGFIASKQTTGPYALVGEFRKALRAWEFLSPQQLQEKAWFVDEDNGIFKESSLKDCLDKSWRRKVLSMIECFEEMLDKAKQEAMQMQPREALWAICTAKGLEKLSSKAKCDSCGERNSTLKKCESCRTESYCSRECQRIAWKAGHKQICRPHDEIKRGDFVWVDGLTSSSDWNKDFALVDDFDDETGRGVEHLRPRPLQKTTAQIKFRTKETYMREFGVEMARFAWNPVVPVSQSVKLDLNRKCSLRLKQTSCGSCGSRGETNNCGGGCARVIIARAHVWKKGHKVSCRPATDLRAGDIVMIGHLFKNGDLNGQTRQLESFDVDKKRWRVSCIDATKHGVGQA